MNETHEYDDIINLEHPTSKVHPRMSKEARAAQFAPFAALTGHDAAIKEVSRLTENEKIIDENMKCILDETLTHILENIQAHPKVTIHYFVPDSKKTGGSYQIKTGQVKKVDHFYECIVFMDGTKIPLKDIFKMEEERFNE